MGDTIKSVLGRITRETLVRTPTLIHFQADGTYFQILMTPYPSYPLVCFCILPYSHYPCPCLALSCLISSFPEPSCLSLSCLMLSSHIRLHYPVLPWLSPTLSFVCPATLSLPVLPHSLSPDHRSAWMRCSLVSPRRKVLDPTRPGALSACTPSPAAGLAGGGCTTGRQGHKWKTRKPTLDIYNIQSSSPHRASGGATLTHSAVLLG